MQDAGIGKSIIVEMIINIYSQKVIMEYIHYTTNIDHQRKVVDTITIVQYSILFLTTVTQPVVAIYGIDIKRQAV